MTNSNETKPMDLLNDPDIIRPMDGVEFGESFIWLSMSDELPIKIDLVKFRSSFKEIASKYPSFNIGAKPPIWINLIIDPEVNITEIDYEPQKEIEDMCPSDKHDNHLWYIHVSYHQNNITRITLHISHALCDGRTLESMFLVVIHSAIHSLDDEERERLLEMTNYKELPPLPEPCNLGEFGQKSKFHIEKLPKEVLNELPKSWNNPTPLNLPQIEIPTNYVGRYFDYSDHDWECYSNKIKKVKNIKLSLQGAMMASESRALRKYCKLKEDYPIVTNVMYDARMNPLAKEEYQKSQFFFGALSGFPVVLGQSDWEQDIIHCTEALRKNVKLYDGLGMMLQIAETMNKETLEFKPYTGIPVYCKNNIVVTTYINQFKGYTNPRIGVRLGCVKDYFVCQYAWRNEGRIYFMILHPKNIESGYINAFKDEFDNLFKFLKEENIQ